MNLVFTGFMGTGKSVIGKKIAARLGFDFYDTDELIERYAELSVSQIFSKLGEEIFRQMEIETVEALSEKDCIVISCGGGIVLNEKNLIKLAKNGIIINLFASPEQIFKRIKGNLQRPLLQCEEPLNKIKELLAERKEAYSNCDFSFNTDNLDIDAIVGIILANEDILKLLKKGKINEARLN